MSKENNAKASDTSKLTPISELGEFGLIRHLTQHIRLKNDSTKKGVGDDAAVIQYDANAQTVISTDMLVEGIHFDLTYCPLKHLGYKAVAVNLSDIFAMNATPKQIAVSVALSSRFTIEAMDMLYDGILTACRFYGVDLIGGDTTSSNKGLIISITAIGEAQQADIVYRHGAKVGDILCLSGTVGDAYLGLQLLEREKKIFLEHPDMQPELAEYTHVVGRQLKPEARNDIIDILSTYQVRPTAMIDISDGLSSELLHICHQSGVGASLFEENIPLHQEMVKVAQLFNVSPITCALNGGEDYELLFTISPADRQKLEGVHGISFIGKIEAAEKGIQLLSQAGNKYDLKAQGWKHL